MPFPEKYKQFSPLKELGPYGHGRLPGAAPRFRRTLPNPLTSVAQHFVKGATLGFYKPPERDDLPRWLTGGAEFVGEMLPLALMEGPAAAVAGLTKLGRVGRAALSGALVGATFGGAKAIAEDEDPFEVGRRAVTNAAMFAGVGAGMMKMGEFLSRRVRTPEPPGIVSKAIPLVDKASKPQFVGGPGIMTTSRASEIVEEELAAAQEELASLTQDVTNMSRRLGLAHASYTAVGMDLPKPIEALSVRHKVASLELDNVAEKVKRLKAELREAREFESHIFGMRHPDQIDFRKLQRLEPGTVVTVEPREGLVVPSLLHSRNSEEKFVRFTPLVDVGTDYIDVPYKALRGTAPRVRVVWGKKTWLPPNRAYFLKLMKGAAPKMIRRYVEMGYVPRVAMEEYLAMRTPASLKKDIGQHSPLELARLTQALLDLGIKGDKAIPPSTRWLSGVINDPHMEVGLWNWLTPMNYTVESLYEKGFRTAVPWYRELTDAQARATAEANEILGPIGIELKKLPRKLRYYVFGEKVGLEGWQIEGNEAVVGPYADQIRKVAKMLQGVTDALNERLAEAGIKKAEQYISGYMPQVERDVLELFGSTRPAKVIQSFILKKRTLPFDPEVHEMDPGKLIAKYVWECMKLLHLKPVVEEWNKMFFPGTEGVLKGVKAGLSDSVRDLMEHYVARVMGRPSKMDFLLAEQLRNIPGLQRIRRSHVTRLAAIFNDSAYATFLGARPFSAEKNLLQPWLTTSVELGPRWVFEGYKYLKGPRRAEMLKYLADRGILARAVGEYHQALSVPLAGAGEAAWKGAMDAAMRLFLEADRANRLVSAGALDAKYWHVMQKLGGEEAVLASKKLQRRLAREVMGAAHVSVRKRIEKLIEQNRFDEVYDELISEVIRSTQYPYGPGQSAAIIQKGGALARMAYVFQTWWPNYLNFLRKQLMAPGDEAVLRIGRIMWGNLILYTLLHQTVEMSERQVRSIIAAGPLPHDMSFPVLRPFAQLASLAVSILKGDDWEVARKKLQAISRQLPFLPFKYAIKDVVGGLAMVPEALESPEEEIPAILRRMMNIHEQGGPV